MYVQFGSSGLEVNVAERLELTYFQFREFYKYAAVSCEALEVGMALFVQVGTHFFDLEIGHITYAPAQCAFVSSRAAELKAFEKSSRRQHLPWSADDLGEADIVGKDTDDMCASGYPDDGFVLFSIDMPVSIYLKKLGMERSLEKAKHQFINCYIDLR